MSVEWVDASALQPEAVLAGWTDDHGSEVDRGNVGLLLHSGDGDGVLLEGTREEVERYLRRALEVVASAPVMQR